MKDERVPEMIRQLNLMEYQTKENMKEQTRMLDMLDRQKKFLPLKEMNRMKSEAEDKLDILEARLLEIQDQRENLNSIFVKKNS